MTATTPHDTRKTFGWMSIVTHWTVALVILLLSLSGPLLAAVPDGAAQGELIDLPKHAGIVAILLTLWRIARHALDPETLPAAAVRP